MPTYTWKEEFIDRRKCSVEADNIKEAIAKKEAGDWSSEETYDFYSNKTLSEIAFDPVENNPGVENPEEEAP